VSRSDDGILRLQLFRTRLSAVWSSSAWADEDYIPVDELIPLVNEGLSHEEMFGSGQARKVLAKMAEGNEVMLDEGLVYRI
jgi:DNA replication licensing factor MCM3